MIRIVGDGIAGLLVARQLERQGRANFLVGDRVAPPRGITALVHPFAGRSLSMAPEEERAWSAAVPVLESFVRSGWATRTVMRRPLASDAGARLLRSFERDEVRLREQWGVRVESDPRLGRCLIYEPAFCIDMREVLDGLRAERAAEPSAFDVTVLAPGARLLEWLEGDDLRAFGGELAVVAGRVTGAVSGSGVHLAPTLAGTTCVGATWWSPEQRPDRDESGRDLTRRHERLVGTSSPLLDVWSGMRCVYQPDRRPVVGWLDDTTLVAGALGSRGWLWAPLVAEQVVGALEGAPVEPALDVSRTSLRLRS